MNNTKSITDAELINNIKEGDKLAISKLVKLYFKEARRFAESLLKGDTDQAGSVTNDAFLSVITAIKDGKYNEKGSFQSYLMTAVRRKALDAIRRDTYTSSECARVDTMSYDPANANKTETFKARKFGTPTDFSESANVRYTEDLDDSDASIEIARQRDSKLTLIWEAVAHLPKLQCDVFCLYHKGLLRADIDEILASGDYKKLEELQGLKYKDIVTVLGLKIINTATSAYQYALKNIKKYIAAQSVAA